MFTLLLVIAAIVLPFYHQYNKTLAVDDTSLSLVQRKALADQQKYETPWERGMVFMWALIIAGIYLLHLVMAGASLDFISTPASHLFSPLIFALILYFRLFYYTRGGPTEIPWVTGRPVEIIVLILVVLVITFLLARLQMIRQMQAYKNEKWEVVTPTTVDRSFFAELILQFRPLFYFPRVYKASENGFLVEGLWYIMPIPFRIVQSMEKIGTAAFLSSGYSLATSVHSLVRIRLTESNVPIYLSPSDREAFLSYCNEQLHKHRPGSTEHGAAIPHRSARSGGAPRH